MDLLELFGVHQITVTPPAGVGARGPIPAAPYVLEGVFVTEKVQLVRNQAGDEVTSTAQIAVSPSATIGADGTTILLPSGRTTRVVSVATTDPNGLPLPDHQVIYCE